MSKNVLELQKLSNASAKRLRQQPETTDALYELLTLFNARLKLLEAQAVAVAELHGQIEERTSK